MSESNGNGKRILSLDDKRMQNPKKGNDFITVQQCYDMVIQECAKVHEFYLAQIPTFMASMIVDALVDRKLIEEFRTGPVATPEATPNAEESPETRESIPPAPPAPDSIAAAEGPSGLLPDADPAA